MKIYIVTINIVYSDKHKEILWADYSHAFTNKTVAQLWEKKQLIRKDYENMLKQALGDMYLEGGKFLFIKDTQIQKVELD